MPIYEYACTKCKNHAEALQKFSDAPLTKCELCNGKLKKLISQSTFHLKGTGWYVTDYASKDKGNVNNSSTDKPTNDDKKLSAKGSDASKESKETKKKPTKTSSAEKKL